MYQIKYRETCKSEKILGKSYKNFKEVKRALSRLNDKNLEEVNIKYWERKEELDYKAF